MKKINLAILIIFSLPLLIYSQQKEEKMLLKNEFYSSYGFNSVQVIGTAIADVFLSLFSYTNPEIKNPVGPIIIGYKRNFGMNFTLGLIGSYTICKSDLRNKNDNSLVSSANNEFYTIMLRQDFIYVTNKWVQVYSGFGFGLSYYKIRTNYTNGVQPTNKNDNMISYQINAIGLRVGNKIGGFAELGFGFNGVINLGISYKF